MGDRDVDWEKKARRAYMLLVDHGTRIEALKRIVDALREHAPEVMTDEIAKALGPTVYVDIYAEELLGYFVEQGMLKEKHRDNLLANLRRGNDALRELARELEEKKRDG